MKKTTTFIDGLIIIEPNCIEDNRGWFMETYSKKKFEELGIFCEFVQDNHSMSMQKGTLRGLHFQLPPMAQAKIIRCTHGRILDVAVDIRKNSPTYKKWFSIELSAQNKTMFFIPAGFAHGFLTLEDDCQIQYKVDNLYSKECDRSLRFDDEDFAIDWGIKNPVLSAKDLDAPFLKDVTEELF